MNYGSSQLKSKSRVELKTAVGVTMFVLLCSFVTHLDYASAQTSNNTATSGQSNSCTSAAKQTYQTALQSAKTTRDSAIQQAKQTDQTAEQQAKTTYQQAAQAAETLYKNGQQANLTATKNTVATAQATLKTALQADKGNPSKIAADRTQYATSVGAAYSQYSTSLYQAASERAHAIWSAAAARDSSIESIRETMWSSTGQAWAAYYQTMYGDQATYYNALAACNTKTGSTSNSG
jgi:hypothetical protein